MVKRIRHGLSTACLVRLDFQAQQPARAHWLVCALRWLHVGVEVGSVPQTPRDAQRRHDGVLATAEGLILANVTANIVLPEGPR